MKSLELIANLLGLTSLLLFAVIVWRTRGYRLTVSSWVTDACVFIAIGTYVLGAVLFFAAALRGEVAGMRGWHEVTTGDKENT